ncbi:MAG: hypothetical protein H7Y88_08975 [Phycisphaerales bacterium]|nr:hypothetical protein [Phycisphaerales bacterium]
MSHAASHAGHGQRRGHADDHNDHDHVIRIDPASVEAPAAWGGTLSTLLIFLGFAGLVVTVFGGYAAAGEHFEGVIHATGSWLVGALFCITLSLGALGLTMIFHQFNAGWSVTARRQLENMASLFPVCLAIFAPVLLVELFITKGGLYHWMHRFLVEAEPGAHVDTLLVKKENFLNIPFFLIRAAAYFGVWIYLGRRMFTLSRTQDSTGDRGLTVKARFTSAWGLLAFALTTAFAGFDWAMSTDPHFYSTMWGVYFFAGSILSATAMLVLILSLLRAKGKLIGLVTDEHFHDLGKLLLSFTVFWAYISFSQYFLIWYSNIPEETSWYIHRRQHGWQNLGFVLCVGHFVVPFLFLLFRGTKKSILAMIVVSLWILTMHVGDLFYIIRPEVYDAKMGLDLWWIDLGGVLGPILLYAGALLRKAASGPLIPLKDPRLAEALAHKNYI